MDPGYPKWWSFEKGGLIEQNMAIIGINSLNFRVYVPSTPIPEAAHQHPKETHLEVAQVSFPKKKQKTLFRV